MPAETHSHAGPLHPDDVSRLVCERLAELLALDEDDVTLDARLREDLDMDDYALLDLVETIEADLGEREIGLHLEDDELQELVTVRDAIDCVLARLDPKASG